MLYVIPCTFKITETGERYQGLAICTTPDDPITFIHSNGMPCVETEVWTYDLHHHQPWAELRVTA